MALDFSEIARQIIGILVLIFAWALFVFATSIAWHLGRFYMDFRMFRMAVAKWQKKDNVEDIDWGIENPNESEKDGDEQPIKKKRR